MNCGRTIDKDYIAAGSPESSIDTLKSLANSRIAAVRRRVAENARTPTEILTVMALDKDPQVRIAVGLNTETPYLVLSELIYDEDPDVRLWLASTSYLPKRLIIELTKDANPFVSHRALRTVILIQAGLPKPRVSIFEFLGQDHWLLVARLESLIEDYSRRSRPSEFDATIEACNCVKSHFERQHKFCLDRISDKDRLSDELLTKIAEDHRQLEDKIDAIMISHSEGVNDQRKALRELLGLVVHHIEFAEKELFGALRRQVSNEGLKEMNLRASQALMAKSM